jgi:hypothetical protein
MPAVRGPDWKMLPLLSPGTGAVEVVYVERREVFILDVAQSYKFNTMSTTKNIKYNLWLSRNQRLYNFF